jgi:hypothetical protein
VELKESADELLQAFNDTEDLFILEESIKLYRSLLNHPLSFVAPAELSEILAVNLGDHFNLTGNRSDLEEAIALGYEVLKLRPVGHPDRSQSCVNLAISLSKCFNQTGDEALLDEAIELNREVLQLQPVGHPDRASSCVNLATSLALRFDGNGDEALLDEAIELEREAL